MIQNFCMGCPYQALPCGGDFSSRNGHRGDDSNCLTRGVIMEYGVAKFRSIDGQPNILELLRAIYMEWYGLLGSLQLMSILTHKAGSKTNVRVVLSQSNSTPWSLPSMTPGPRLNTKTTFPGVGISIIMSIESTSTTYMEDVSTWVLEKIKNI